MTVQWFVVVDGETVFESDDIIDCIEYCDSLDVEYRITDTSL